MSESSKMGLFGSKDDNAGASTTGDENKESPKAKENSSERYNVPYNIDSDSETYDTEALSIMDINDIIGVQAESASDSTLESEFAALSEVITDCKDEFSSKIDGDLGAEDKAVGKSDKKRENYGTKKEGLDSTKEDTRSQADDKKSRDTASMASISKSLQLIGEAYISEDSQETDTEDIPESSLPKVADLGECLRTSKNDGEDIKKITEKPSDEAVGISSGQATVSEQTIGVPATTDLEKDAATEETAKELQKLREKAPASPKIDKSIDSTDSAVIDKSVEKPDEENKTENMDIDRSPSENIIEATATENQSKSKAEAIKDDKVVYDSQVESAVVETEEPMEVDQVNDELSANIETEKIDSVNAREAINNYEKPSEPLVTEETKIASENDDVQPEENKKCIDEVSAHDKTSSQPEDIKESVAPVIQQEALIEVVKVVEEEPRESAESSKNEQSSTEKLEMENNDSQIEDRVAENVESEKPETDFTVENVIAGVLTEKAKETEERPGSPQKLANDIEKESPPSVQEVIESEPMEVDDNLINEQPETESDKPVITGSELSVNYSEIVGSISDISLKESTSEESVVAEPELSEDASKIAETVQGESTSDTMLVERPIDKPVATALSESSSTTVEAVETESEPIITSKENPNEQSVASASDLSKKSPAETVQVDSTPEVESKETTNEESIVTAAESCVKISSIAESSQMETIPNVTSEEFATRILTKLVAEDEKMEVDAGAKTEKREEKESETCRPERASQELEKSPASIVPEVDTAEEESTIGKAVESDIQEVANVSLPVVSPEVTETEKTVEETIEVPIEFSSATSPEIETPEIRAGETVSEVMKVEKDNSKEDLKVEIKELPISIEKAESSTEKSPEVETSAIEKSDDAVEQNEETESKPEIKEEKKEPFISTEISEPSIVSETGKTLDKSEKLEKKELPIFIEMAEFSTEKSPEIRAIETPDEAMEENEKVTSKPETEEKDKEPFISTEVSELSIVSEAVKTLPDAVEEDAKDEEGETKEEESSIAIKTAVSDSTPIKETIQVQTKLEYKIHQKSTEEPAQRVSAIEAESQQIFSKPDIPREAIAHKDMSSSSMNIADGEEDPVEEEMNLSLDPEITESQEDRDEEAQSIGQSLPSEQMAEDPEEEIEDIVEMNLSLDPEEKINELPSESDKTTVEDCVEESSMTSTGDKPEESEERLEKPCEDLDENSKDIERTTVSVPEIFHDDQSQTTQEMMESILETDTGNLNKILDAEEAEGEALARSNALPLESAEIDELSDKLPSESEEMLNKELDDPMSSQNIDSLEGLLDLDLIPESDEPALKVVQPIIEKVMSEAEEDIETIGKDVDVSLLLEETEQSEDSSNDVPKVVEEIAAAEKIAEAIDIVAKSVLDNTNDPPLISPQLASAASELIDNDLEAAFDLSSVVANQLEAVPLVGEDTKMDLDEDLLREIAVDQERKMELAEQLFLESAVPEETKIDLPDDLLLRTAVQDPSKINLSDEGLLENAEENIVLADPSLLESAVEAEEDIADPVIAIADPVLLQSAVEADKKIVLGDPILLQAVVPEDSKMELSEDVSLDSSVRDQVLTDVAAEIEDLAPSSEISELESAVKFLQESEEQDIDSPLVLSPKLVESVVDDIPQEADVGIFAADPDICEDPSELVAELESIIPDPIAISEAEIISEAVKLESERKTIEEAKLQSPISKIVDKQQVELSETPSPLPVAQEFSANILPHPETPKTHREPRETIAKSLIPEKIAHQPLLKKSVPIPKISILEERLKIPPKIEIPVGEVSRICEMPTTPKTSLLIQRDAKLASYQKMLESPKNSEKTELKIVDTPRKDAEKHDFENVGSPRIILKIAKSAIADCGEPRSPKSPKIRSATNSPNPEDSPGQKLGKIKLKLSKGGHPSIIPNDNVEEICGQWHTEGTSSLSPLGMKIKFSKTGDASIVQAEKHESPEETKEQPKHKFEEAKRTESPIGMKIKLSRTGDPSIVQQDTKESTSKHKDKLEMMQGSPKRTESPIGMKIKLSKSGDASIIQPEKQDASDEHREGSRGKDKLDVPQDIPRRTESPLGMKIKLFKTGDASIVPSETAEDCPQELKRTDSPLGMKIKLSKTRGGASIVPVESNEGVKEKLEIPEVPRRTESPLGMKIKLSKSGDASIIHSEESKESSKHKEKVEASQDSILEASLGVKIKVTKCGDASIVQPEVSVESDVRMSSIGMKIKLSKTGDASIVHSDSQEQSEDSRSSLRVEKIDSSIGMKIKLSKTGDASIIHNPKKSEEPSSAEIAETEHKKSTEAALGMKIKLQKSGDASIVETDKKDKSSRRKETESPLEMKIKLSKTGHPTIVACENYGETSQRPKESTLETITHSHSHKHKESLSPKENPGMKMLKSMQTSNLQGGRSELSIEPIQLQSRKSEVVSELSPKRKDVTISPVESKKAKLEAKLSQMLPEVTIQPIKPRDPKQMMFDAKASSISRQQMNVISQEISITQVRSNKPMDLSMTDKLKSMLTKNANTSVNSDCEIIERRPELIIVNENSNSSQEVMIIEEVPLLRGPDAKVPKKRGRPRRNPLPLLLAKPLPQGTMPTDPLLPRDPLALDDVTRTVGQLPPQNFAPKENERPKRSCSRQKSYAPPRRGRGRGGGRGKRKMEVGMELGKKPRIEQDLDMIERSTTALITIDEPSSQPDISHSTSELYKALRQPPMDSKMANAMARVEAEQAVNDANLMAKSRMESLMDSRLMSHLGGVMETTMNKSAAVESFDSQRKMSLESLCESEGQVHMATDQMEKSELLTADDKIMDKAADEVKDGKDASSTTDHQNWLTPSSKKQLDGRNEGNISNVQVIDEETRMSAESGSRSQTPARNMTVQAPETIVNEESQGSVLSTATTESEKVKVKNRRMEINFDPDEGPFTVDKVAEYEWPPDPTRKSETFMIQEQISQYLGVKSFKRKYPDLKRRMVDMEERNFLRENALVSEAMCDMGLTAVSSSEVLDVMCSDFPDQYEEYRKYIREKQMKEHSKKQKELTAAANAERNRIDLAEMAVQSALSWNVGLNKARRDSRKCSLDLQTFTIHVPKKQQKVEEESKVSHYPVALIPGQYTDYYREYTPAELRYYPLNTVLYGPMKPNERKFDSQSEGSQSDSDSDSSSDDSSSSSSDGTQDTEESQSTMDEVDVELSRQKEDIKSIKCKMCLKHLNKFSRSEVLIQCGTCNGYVHPSCIDLTLDMVPHIQAYAWQCTDCKTCAQCHDPADEDKMLFCDMCDRGYHIYCVGLRRVPQGRWHCQECAVCASCGSREAGGANSDRNSVAQWQHEYKKGDKNTRVYVSTLCVPCSKLWRKGRYCPHCSRCHTVPRLDLEANLVHCSACDKYLHLGCVETKDLTIDRKNYLCDFCQPSRQQMVKPLVSKVFRT